MVSAPKKQHCSCIQNPPYTEPFSPPQSSSYNHRTVLEMFFFTDAADLSQRPIYSQLLTLRKELLIHVASVMEETRGTWQLFLGKDSVYPSKTKKDIETLQTLNPDRFFFLIILR